MAAAAPASARPKRVPAAAGNGRRKKECRNDPALPNPADLLALPAPDAALLLTAVEEAIFADEEEQHEEAAANAAALAGLALGPPVAPITDETRAGCAVSLPLPPGCLTVTLGPVNQTTYSGAISSSGTLIDGLTATASTRGLCMTYKNEIWTQWQSVASCQKQHVWYQWASANTTATVTSVNACNMIWGQWVQDGNSQTKVQVAAQPAPPPDPALVQQRLREQAERRARQAQEAAEYQERQRLRVQNLEAASERARRLLLRYLKGKEREQYEQYQYVDVEAPSGRLYRIMPGTHGNVREMARQPDGGLRAIASLCCQPVNVPEGDAHLTQLLALQYNEDAFRAEANIRTYDPMPEQGRGRAANLEDRVLVAI